MNLRWEWKPFNELSAEEMYTVLCVRQEVFVLEQECLYLDADGKAKINQKLNIGKNAPGMLTAQFLVRAFENGGDFSLDAF
ncbi:MAG: hypothetical protein ACPG5W_08440, partial [Flavobacteriales bacterium]